MGEKTSRYMLYVDETGTFEGRVSAAVGVLFERNRLAEARKKVEFAENFPEAEWPPHSTVVRRSAYWVKRALATSNTQVELYCKGLSVADLKALTSSNLGVSELTRLSRILEEQCPSASVYGRDRARKFEEFMVGSLQGFEVKAFVGGTSTPNEVPATTDEYMNCMTDMIERVNFAYSKAEADANVGVIVARRRALLPTLGKVSEFGRAHLEWVHGNVSQKPPRGLRFSSDGFQKYDEDISFGLVAADFVANHLLGSLRGNLFLLKRVSESLGVAVEFNQVPTLASCGDIRHALIAGGELPNEVKPKWALEQAKIMRGLA